MLKKVIRKIQLTYIKGISYFNVKKYMALYTKYLQQRGVNIADYNGLGYIDTKCDIDGARYDYITIGKEVTISKNTMLLVHDFSIGKGMRAEYPNMDKSKRFEFIKPVTIGNNVFIGAGTIILPGTAIGDNVIIGAGSVVKGNIRGGVIAAGNPCKPIAELSEWTEKHVALKDYVEFSSK
jgi:acetyltransferase-like isoleucine patch superfamily enzyme